MKKQLIIALAFSISRTLICAKERIERLLRKLLKDNNYAEAKAAITQARGLNVCHG